MKIGIYIFTRDLRIQDNKCLYDSIQENDIIYPIFILTPEQVKTNPYINKRAINFMCQSLKELSKNINICFFEGKTISILEKIIKDKKIDNIYINGDVSPFAMKRENDIENFCKENNIIFHKGLDVFFCRSTLLLRINNKPYLKFTPFYNNAIQYTKKETICPTPNLKKVKEYHKNTEHILDKYIFNDSDSVYKAGRKAGKYALEIFCKKVNNYARDRDLPIKNGNSHLAAYLHFGVLSPTEIALATKNTDFIRQLIWREFYLYINKYTHLDYSKLSHTMPKRNKLKWKSSSVNFKKWCDGKTGCPIVDAGMRELNKTGYMHNRLRMIVAMYLIFYLQLDWRLGEKYFAQNLCDYDYSNNLGGWMWCASWESWSNDYFRVFAMPSQMKRYDHDAEYVKKWIPELNEIPARDLYDWSSNYKKYPNIKYVKPISQDLNIERKEGISLYK
jgi:deoxyribodipyrimidine photo-lyase